LYFVDMSGKDTSKAHNLPLLKRKKGRFRNMVQAKGDFIPPGRIQRGISAIREPGITPATTSSATPSPPTYQHNIPLTETSPTQAATPFGLPLYQPTPAYRPPFPPISTETFPTQAAPPHQPTPAYRPPFPPISTETFPTQAAPPHQPTHAYQPTPAHRSSFLQLLSTETYPTQASNLSLQEN
jgi:hypothetical protein